MGNPALSRDEERERAIVQDYESEVNTLQIQEKYDISPGQLYRILDKYGVKPRRASTGVRVQAQPERTDRPTEPAKPTPSRVPAKEAPPKVAPITVEEAIDAQQSERRARVPEKVETPAPEPEVPHTVIEQPEPKPVAERPGYVFVATVEFRTRNVVRITASSIVDAARQAGEIVSPTGGPVDVVMLARED